VDDDQDQRTRLGAPGGGRTDATDTATSPTAAQTGRARPIDEVQPSPGVQLAGDAVKAATGVPDVRSAVVERARALLESGQLDEDPYSLADVLIDLAIDGE